MDTTQLGTRSYNVYQNNCYDTFAPVRMMQETNIDITHPNCDITILNKSWLNVEVEVEWSVDQDVVGIRTDQYIAGAQPAKPAFTTYLFLGWKNAAEFIKQIEVYNGPSSTGYLQPDNELETFVQQTKYNSRTGKKENKTSHTVYKDMNEHNTNVCGTYIPANQTYRRVGNAAPFRDEYFLAGGQHYTTTFTMMIPITEIPAFKFFKEYPKCFGPLTLKLKFDPSSMVWGMPDAVAHPFGANSGRRGVGEFPHRFSQVDNTANIITVLPFSSLLAPTVAGVKFTLHNATIKKLTADIAGYNITREGKDRLSAEFTPMNPYIVPCLYSYFRTFDGQIQSGSFNIEFPFAVHNVKDIHLVFPKDGIQKTCFRNPMLKGLQLKINNVQYPRMALRTDDARFAKYQINGYEADKDYENSITLNPVDASTGQEIANPMTDDTAFICTIAVERDNEPDAWDGLETGDENINFNLAGERIYDQNAIYGQGNEPSPYIWFTSKAYWTADSTNGLVFHRLGTPNF